MKRSIIMCLIFTLIFSNSAFAIKYSENGMADGEAQIVTRTVYEQDFENLSSYSSTVLKTYVAGSNSASGATLTEDPEDSTNTVFRVGCTTSGSNPAITVKTDKYTSTDKTLGFVDGETYTITFDLYYYSSTGRTSAVPYIWWNADGITSQSKSMAYKNNYTITPGEWTTFTFTCQYKASVLGEKATWARIGIPNSTNGDFVYLDNVSWTYTEQLEAEKVPVDWISYEDFEDPASYEFSTTASADNTMSYGGESGTSTTHEAVTVGDTTAFGMIGRGVKYSSGSSKIVQGTSRRLKIWNIFNTEEKTPLNGTAPTWSKGWDMFTEDDIGREFEVSLSVYCPSSDGAWPYTLPTEYDEEGNVKGTADTTRTYGFLSGDEIDLDNDDTKPSIRVGLMGPTKSTANVNVSSWEYGSDMYISASKAIEWNEWTEFKFIYTVTADTIFTSATTNNPLVNAIGIDSSGGGVSLYYPSTFYVDNVMVKELTVTPNLYLESEDKVKADIYVPAGMIDGKDNAMVIAGMYDGNNLVDANALTALSDATVTCEFDVNFAADLIMKLYLWDGVSLVPYMNHVNWEVPTIEEFKSKNRIDRIAQSFHGDVYTQKAFNWYSTKICSGDIAYVEKTSDTPDWSKASYVESEPSIERLHNFLEYSAVRHKALVTGLTPNTEYYYKVGNKEFDVWSDTYTFKTSDNTTDDGRFFLLADPQTSGYAGAVPKGQMLNYIIDEYDGEFILSAGDLVITHNIEQEWIDTFNAQSFTTPNITFNGAPGDHDTAGREDGEGFIEQQYSKHFNYPLPEGASKGITYYSFDYKDFHIAILDTTMLTNDGGDIGSEKYEQLDWLKADMNASDKKWKVVITHEQPQAGTLVSNKLTGTSYRRKVALMPVFTELGIDLVLGGDTHRYSRTYPIYGYGGDLNTETNKVEPFEGKTELGNPNPTIVKTETINGKETKFFDATEGVTYVTLGSVNKSSVAWSANALDPEVSYIPSYDIVGIETGVTSGSIRNIGTYSVLDYVDGEIIISVYHYDYANPQNGGTLFDQFALTK